MRGSFDFGEIRNGCFVRVQGQRNRDPDREKTFLFSFLHHSMSITINDSSSQALIKFSDVLLKKVRE